jgi:hypothetical protein
MSLWESNGSCYPPIFAPNGEVQFEQQGNDCQNSNKGEMKAASSRRSGWKRKKLLWLLQGVTTSSAYL